MWVRWAFPTTSPCARSASPSRSSPSPWRRPPCAGRSSSTSSWPPTRRPWRTRTSPSSATGSSSTTRPTPPSTSAGPSSPTTSTSPTSGASRMGRSLAPGAFLRRLGRRRRHGPADEHGAAHQLQALRRRRAGRPVRPDRRRRRHAHLRRADDGHLIRPLPRRRRRLAVRRRRRRARPTPPRSARRPLDAPTASLASGFFDTGETVALSARRGRDDPLHARRVGPDGARPRSTPSPSTLDATTVLRAAAFAPDREPSRPSRGRSSSDEASTLPVISLVTDPAGFFSDTTGIYVEGTNGIPGRCRDDAGQLESGLGAGGPVQLLRAGRRGRLHDGTRPGRGRPIFGGCSRIYPQKSLALHARSRYGASDFGYRFFADVDID